MKLEILENEVVVVSCFPGGDDSSRVFGGLEGNNLSLEKRILVKTYQYSFA